MKAMSTLINILLVITIITSCQNDIDIDTSNNDTNNSDSVFTSKVRRTSMFNGAFDDILDGSPCFAIQYPINILLNTIPTTLNSQSDLGIITATDIIQISYPIVLTNYDYTETNITNQQEFNTAVSSCQSLVTSGNGPIDCIDFIYPLSIFTATKNQSQDIFEITSNQELYTFINNLDNNTLYSFQFPLQILEPNLGNITIENNTALDTYLGICL